MKSLDSRVSIPTPGCTALPHKAPRQRPLLQAAFLFAILWVPIALDNVMPKSQPYHVMVYTLSTIPIALASYFFGLAGGLTSGLLNTTLVWFNEHNWVRGLQVLQTRSFGILEGYVAVFSLAMAVCMGILAEILHRREAALSAANAQLAEMAVLDPLTGLANTRAFWTGIRNACTNALKEGSTVALLLLDLDNFKAYNDRYGHQAGDALLASVGQVLRENVRSSDIPCRYGGDELAVVLPGTELPEAMKLAERMRQKVAALDLPPGASASGVRVSVSVGIAVLPLHADSCDSLVSAADKAMYMAKRQGRNHVAMADSSTNPGSQPPHP